MKSAPFSETWQELMQLKPDAWMMYKQSRQNSRLTILIQRSISLIQPLRFNQSQQLFHQYSNPCDIPTVGERLRYFRYKQALLQSDIASATGIDVRTYSHYENTCREYYPADKIDQIAAVLAVSPLDLLDSYNRFLYDGQGKNIKLIRKGMKLTQYEFGKLLDVPTYTVKKWEQNRIRITKDTWLLITSLNPKG